MEPIHPLDQFLNLSVVLTGFNKVELQATGVGLDYLTLLMEMAGDTLCFELWAETQAIYAKHAGNAARLESEVHTHILKSAKYAPLARNIILLWYNAIWYQLPPDWTTRHGANAVDQDHVVSAKAYPEALIWQAIGAHPPAAKPQGYGAWALPPAGVEAPAQSVLPKAARGGKA
jgi:hypothetical protein